MEDKCAVCRTPVDCRLYLRCDAEAVHVPVGSQEAHDAPPFDKVGVIDLETFYPAKERFTLAMRLNNLLASPGFAASR